MVQRLRYVGLAPEAIFAEEPSPEAVIHMDIASATLDAPADSDLLYEGGLSRSAYTRRPGFYAPEGNFMYAFDIDSIAHLLYWTLGGYAFTADNPEVGLNLHEFWGSADSLLPSFVTRLGKDKFNAPSTDFEHVFRGCTVGQLGFSVSDAFAEVTADITAAKDGRDDIKDVGDLILPGSYPLAFHELTATIDGVDESANIKEVSFSINNNPSADDGRSI